MLLHEGEAKAQYGVSPANRRADGETESDIRTIPPLLHQLQTRRLGRLATASRVYIQ